jgi:hypothetical protein
MDVYRPAIATRLSISARHKIDWLDNSASGRGAIQLRRQEDDFNFR